MRSFLCKLSLAAVLAVAPLAAQAGAPNTAPIPPAPVTAPLPEPPTRVGRLSLVSGKVWFRAAGMANWSAAAPNFPVAAGTALRTDPQSRAIIEIGPHTLDVAQGSEIGIARLDRHLIALALPQGRLYLHLRHLAAGESVEIAVAGGGVRLSTPGAYDIAAGNQKQPARIAVVAGRARFAGGGADIGIEPGRMAVLGGAPGFPPPGESRDRAGAEGRREVRATQGVAAADDFDSWSRAQDYRQARLVSPYCVSPEMTGYAALDGHGLWQDNGRYGEVWYPDGLPANWAPFRFGHWQRIAPWGWTWIDDQSWGFAPSHYGRWAVIDKRWAWVPGHFVEHPAYVPAVVAFLGTPGVGLSVANSAIPAIGWFPLAPGEVYWPSYARSLDYVRKLNQGDIADLAAVSLGPDGKPPVEIVVGQFNNRQMASVIPRPDFIAGHPVATALLQLPEERLRNAPVIAGSPRLGPAPAPLPAVAVAGAAPARHPADHNAMMRKPERVAARHKPEARPAPPQRVAQKAIVRARRPVRFERRIRIAHLRVPAYAGHALRARHFVAYHPARLVRRVRR